jgi:hypothetical protein
VKRIYEQEEIYNGMMNAIDEKDRVLDRMEKDYSRKLAEKNNTLKKKDNEIRKLKEILMAAGMSPEAIELRLST